MPNYLDNYNRWLTSDKLTDAEKAELLSIKDDDKEIQLRFTDYLSFGTAGLRGTMKVGMNAMNVHTLPSFRCLQLEKAWKGAIFLSSHSEPESAKFSSVLRCMQENM